MTVQRALAVGTGILKDAGIAGAARDARVIMAASLGIDPGRVTLHLQDDIEAPLEIRFFALIQQRAERVPVSHIVGGRMFYGRWFAVNGDVLDPRPETETLIETALAAPFQKVLDLGTGSGAILVTLLAERPGATGTATDISAAALRVAEQNAGALGVADRMTLVKSDWFAGVGGQFDLIVSNPPYIARAEMDDLAEELTFEPRTALTDEADGLSAYYTIAEGAGEHLMPGGRLMVEIGRTQAVAVTDIFAEAGFADIQILPDMDGRDRVVSAKLGG